MEEYNDPNEAKLFTEDGSWIGQYASTTVRSNEAVVTTTVQQPSGSTFVQRDACLTRFGIDFRPNVYYFSFDSKPNKDARLPDTSVC